MSQMRTHFPMLMIQTWNLLIRSRCNLFRSSFLPLWIPVFCLFEFLGPIPTRGGGGIVQRRKRLKIGGYRMERKNPRRRSGHFYDNVNFWEMPFRSEFLPLWMLFSAFLNAWLLSFEVIMIRNELFPCVFSRHWFRRLRRLLFLAWPIRLSVGST